MNISKTMKIAPAGEIKAEYLKVISDHFMAEKLAIRSYLIAELLDWILNKEAYTK